MSKVKTIEVGEWCRSGWISGTFENSEFEAKLYDVSSDFGYYNSRVSKLAIYKDGKEMFNYDRGMDFNNFSDRGSFARRLINALEKAVPPED